MNKNLDIINFAVSLIIKAAAYRKEGSYITRIVPAPVSANPISSFQVSKNNFGGTVITIEDAFVFSVGHQ